MLRNSASGRSSRASSFTLPNALRARSTTPRASTDSAAERSDSCPSSRRFAKVAPPLTVTRGAVSDFSLPLVIRCGSSVPTNV